MFTLSTLVIYYFFNFTDFCNNFSSGCSPSNFFPSLFNQQSTTESSFFVDQSSCECLFYSLNIIIIIILLLLYLQNPLNFTTVDGTVLVGSVTNYTLYINSNLVSSEPSCMDEGCNYFVNDDDFPPTTCMTSSDISVKISASNTVGEGQASAGTLIGMLLCQYTINKFQPLISSATYRMYQSVC